MAKLYSNIVNFIAHLDNTLKILISALLLLFTVMQFMKVVKKHYNVEKFSVKFGMIFLLILLGALSGFFVYYAFF